MRERAETDIDIDQTRCRPGRETLIEKRKDREDNGGEEKKKREKKQTQV